MNVCVASIVDLMWWHRRSWADRDDDDDDDGVESDDQEHRSCHECESPVLDDTVQKSAQGVELGSRKRKAVRMPNLRWAMEGENTKNAATARTASATFRASANGGQDARMRKGSSGKTSSPGAGLPSNGGVPVDDAPPPGVVNPAAASLCAGCGLPIVDRYILRVMDHSWHESCLQCSICHAPLEQSCYSRDRKLFCKADYDK